MNFWLSFSLILLVIYGYYRLILARQATFQRNRFFLLSMVPLSALLAYVRVPLRGTPELIETISLSEITIFSEATEMSANSAFDWSLLYWAGVLMSLMITLIRFLRLFQFIHRHPHTQQGTYTLVSCQLKDGPASFFRYILWNNTTTLNAQERAQILAHEQCHVQQKHSWDRLIVELMLIFCWFHPLVYLIRRDLLQTHEFLADRAATREGDIRKYASLLLSRAVGARMSLSHSFFHSPVKNRIMMLQTSASRNSSLRYLGILPLMGLMFVLFACQPEKEQKAVLLPEASAQTPGIKDFVQVDEEPKPINMNELYKKIGYPKAAREAGIEGTVVARVLIDEKGQYVEHEILNEAHAILSTAVEEQLPSLTMTPAIKDDIPVKFWVNIPFNFKLIE